MTTTDYDFGRIGELDGKVYTTFTVRNMGTEPLILSSVKASCGCTSPQWSKEPISQGKTGEIIVSYNPMGRPGRFQKTVTIQSSNGEIAKAYIRGEVVAGQRGITKAEYLAEPNAQLASATLASVPNKTPNSDRKASQDKEYESKLLSQAQQARSSLVDVDIPKFNGENNNVYVLIVANEQYEYLDNVTYAKHDGQIFRQYCVRTLGIPERQIFYYENATYGKIADGIDKLRYVLDNFEGSKAIVYYCGHGIPDEKTGQAYLIPVDGKGTNMTTCYSLNTLYKTLAATKAESITYFMDACFTGANKEGSMLVAARGVALKPKKEVLEGKSIVFSASSGDETAMTLAEQGHGLFTYYLLKKLQETSGNVTYGELADYINRNVKKDAFLINEKPQTPVVATSPAVVNTWRSMKL